MNILSKHKPFLKIISIVIIQTFLITNIGVTAFDFRGWSLRRQGAELSNRRVIYSDGLKDAGRVTSKGRVVINSGLSEIERKAVEAHEFNHIFSFYLIKHKRDVWNEIERAFVSSLHWDYILREFFRIRVNITYKKPLSDKQIGRLSNEDIERRLEKSREFGLKKIGRKRPSDTTRSVETNWVVEILGLWSEGAFGVASRVDEVMQPFLSLYARAKDKDYILGLDADGVGEMGVCQNRRLLAELNEDFAEEEEDADEAIEEKKAFLVKESSEKTNRVMDLLKSAAESDERFSEDTNIGEPNLHNVKLLMEDLAIRYVREGKVSDKDEFVEELAGLLTGREKFDSERYKRLIEITGSEENARTLVEGSEFEEEDYELLTEVFKTGELDEAIADKLSYLGEILKKKEVEASEDLVLLNEEEDERSKDLIDLVREEIDKSEPFSPAGVILLIMGINIGAGLLRYLFGLEMPFWLESSVSMPFLLFANMVNPGREGGEWGVEEAEETIERYGIDYSRLAKQGKIDDSSYIDNTGRDVQRIISGHSNNNVEIIGDMEKVENIIKGLTFRIAKNPKLVSKELKDVRVIALNMMNLLDTLSGRERFEDEISRFIDAVRFSAKKKKILLFINLEDYDRVRALKWSRGVDVMELLKEISYDNRVMLVIGSNPRLSMEHKVGEIIKKKVEIETPPHFHTRRAIDKFLREAPAKYSLPAGSKVSIDDETMEFIVGSDKEPGIISDQIENGELPEKALEVLDMIVAERIREQMPFLNNVTRDILSVLTQLKSREAENDPELKEYLYGLLDKDISLWEELSNKKAPEVVNLHISRSDVLNKVSELTGISVKEMLKQEDEKLASFVKDVSSLVIGQNHAVKQVYERLRMRRRGGGISEEQPIGFFIFTGPTGVGKTEMAKAIARQMFGDEERLVRLDMSEYKDEAQVSRLEGQPIIYKGVEKGGDLTEAVKSKGGRCVVLLDEIEKAHKSVFKKLLTVMDKGYMTDGMKGERVDFRNVLFIATANIGYEGRDSVLYANAQTLSDKESQIREIEGDLADREAVKELFPEYLSSANLGQQEVYVIVKGIELLEDSSKERKGLIKDIRKGIDAAVSKVVKDRTYEDMEFREEMDVWHNLFVKIGDEELLKIVEICRLKEEISKLREETGEGVNEAARKVFDPEFIGRTSGIIPFNPLSKENLERIVDLRIEEINERLAKRGIILKITRTMRSKLISEGYDPVNGARPLTRAIERIVENPLARRILKGETKNAVVTANWLSGKIWFKEEALPEEKSTGQDYKNRDIIQKLEGLERPEILSIEESSGDTILNSGEVERRVWIVDENKIKKEMKEAKVEKLRKKLKESNQSGDIIQRLKALKIDNELIREIEFAI